MKSKQLILLALCAFFYSFTQARIYTREEYNFPITDGYWATMAAALNGTKLHYSTFRMEIRPERRNVPLIGDRSLIPINIFVQKKTDAPLAFVISGLGGSAFSGTALTLAEQVYRQGYHVITLPNPMSWQYALSISASGAPGYLPQDAVEYYEFLTLVTNRAKQEYGIRPTRFRVMGYSYGGLLTAFLTDLDLKKKYFKFDQSIIINPGIDLKYGMETLDGFYSLGNKWSLNDQYSIRGLVIDMGLKLIEKDQTSYEQILNEINLRPKLSDNQKKWIIGDVFRSDLRDIIFVSQQIKDQGILKHRATQYKQNARYAEAKQISFAGYLNKIIIPRNNLEIYGSASDILANGSFYNVLKRISRHESVFVLESEDDFLMKKGDLEFLESEMKDRFYLYPYGGHVGNVRFSINSNDLRDILSTIQPQ